MFWGLFQISVLEEEESVEGGVQGKSFLCENNLIPPGWPAGFDCVLLCPSLNNAME